MPAAPSLSVHQVLPLTDAGGLAPDTAEPVTLVGGCGVGGIQPPRLQPCSPQAALLSSVFYEALVKISLEEKVQWLKK